MKRYHSYKPSNIEWIGEIPESWDSGKMKYVLSNNDGGVWGTDIEDEDEGTLVVRSTEISIDGKWDLSQILKRNLTESEVSKCKLYEGDIVITKSSGSPQHIGKSVIVSKEIEKLNCCYSNFVQRIRFKNYNSKLYHYILNCDMVREQFKYLTTSSTGLGNLNGTSLNDILLPFIPIQEQQQIVQFLDEKTELIDKLISTKERKITLLKEQRTTLINQVITKGLNPKVKMKDSGVEWIGEIPEDWDFGKLKYFTTLVTDGSHFSPEVIDEGRFYISVTDITKDNRINFDDCKKISNESFEELERNGCRPQIGDILVTKDGTIGRGCVVNDLNDFVILSSLGLIRVKPQHSNKYFLYYLLSGLNIDQMYSHIRGSGITRLTIKLINDLIVVIPTISEQHKIVEYLDSKTKEIDDLVQLEQKKIDLLKEYRQSLISEVVTGKIKVTTDE